MVAPPPPLEDAAISRENNRAPSRVCRLRGLPYTASDDDIRSFFCNFTLDEVYICRRDGKTLQGLLRDYCTPGVHRDSSKL